jgi:spore maturation protein CgeB
MQHVKKQPMNIVIIGLAITSSWGNGHATTYRSLVKGLHRQGHRVLFLEQDQPWYEENRDAPELPYCETKLYESFDDLKARFTAAIRNADAVIVGSYVRSGVSVIDWVLSEARGVRAFYDIDTPVTLACLRSDSCEYLRAHQIEAFDLMLSFTGGPTLAKLEAAFGAKRAVPLYCSVDADEYRRRERRKDIDLGYMGTYSADRQPGVETFLNEPARRLPERRFMLVGAQYPTELNWPANVLRADHLPPADHAEFYSRQRWTLNITRADMRAAGHSPSVRLFEAAACGTPIISDAWPGIEDVLEPDKEVMIARSSEEVVRILSDIDMAEGQRIAEAARARVLSEHCSERRAEELIGYLQEAGNAVASARDRALKVATV